MASSCGVSSRKLRAFKRWMKSQGIQWSSDALQFIDDPKQGISIRALRDLREGEVVASIPKTACLTTVTTGARHMIEAAGFSGCLGLSLAIMYEHSLGNQSPWAAYLHLLPPKECLPLLWTPDEIDHFLCGTELHKIVKEDQALICDDWKENILPLVHSHHLNSKFFGVDEYFSARSLVASRSFQIDDFHGIGMVPLADLFNHKTGAEDVHFTCGSSESDPGSDNDHDSSNNIHEAPSSALECTSDEPELLEMIMVNDVKAGVEVFNTYGSAGNAGLLHRYGFTEPDNPYNIVNIDLDLVVEWSLSLFSSRYSRPRLSLWRKLDYSGCVSENAEYFEVSFDGNPQVELLILLYIMLLPEADYHTLDIAITTTNRKKSTRIILLEECDILVDGKGLELSKDLLLTNGVCDALLWLADKRESMYGSCSMKDDTELLENCTENDRKLYHSLMLRMSERRILEKLRQYAAAGIELLKHTKRSSKSKKLKRTCIN